MKKFLKILFIAIASFLAILVGAISIVLWLVFTPEKLTPIVRDQAKKFINCQTEIGEVELTFFSTLPQFGFKVHHFALINPVAGAQCDTLVQVDQMVGVVDVEAWWKNNKLILTDFILTKGNIHAFADSLGNTNFDIVILDTTSTQEVDQEIMFSFIDIENIELENINLSYVDNSLKLETSIRDLAAKISGTIHQDSVTGHIKISHSDISLEYDGEKYLQNASVQLDLATDIILSRQFIRFKEASASINDLGLILSGTIENDTINKNIIADIIYQLKSWQVKNMLAIVPPSFHPYFEGIDADGILSSEGTIKGIFNDSIMPFIDVHLLLENGTIGYAGFPVPLSDIFGDIDFYSDLKTDSLTSVQINRFDAKTPKSAIEAKGMVNDLFTDIHLKLTTNASISLAEFNPMLPAEMKTSMKGNVRGKLKSDFSMSQLEAMQFDKMKLSGSFTVIDLDVSYDSLSIKTDHSEIAFALPNPYASTKKTNFAFIKIDSDNLATGKLEGFKALLENALITLETSDIRDTTFIPDLIFSFVMDSLAVSMDTMSIAVAKPYGKMSVSPTFYRSKQPKIKLAYNSGMLETNIGQNSAAIEKLGLETEIINDNSQKDVFLQWLVKGFIEMDQGNISVSSLSYPLEIPAIKMDFEPEVFNIKESKMRIGNSDFQLSGTLNNVLSYFRNDSIMRGNFIFVSETTDILQIMNLTSGMENEATIKNNPEEDSESMSSEGPYMVPKGMDILLSTNIENAIRGIDTISNIIGTIHVNDGILLFDGLTFETSAANMQLTAMYRTPRNNHLFLGLDYHMFDVEIEELLKMIPEIDTLMPMLRSFGGRGEFHIAVETYLDSLYNIKKSTLRGASSITGQDLVLMDGETFSEIAKTFKFKKSTENKVDTLSAEFTIFREEIDVYPFLIVMDKYKAVIAGRHNFDLSFDYHISVVDCPLPIKLGMDIKGTMEDFNYRLAKCKYAELYRPASRRVVENKQLELRKMIRDALTLRIKE